MVDAIKFFGAVIGIAIVVLTILIIVLAIGIVAMAVISPFYFMSLFSKSKAYAAIKQQ